MGDNFRLPTQSLQDLAFRRFGETDETRAAKLIELRRAVEMLHGYNSIDTSDWFLMRYLRGKEFQVNVAVKAIENFIDFNQKHPEWMQNWTQQEFSAFKSVLHVLKARDKAGRILMLLHVKNFIRVFTPEYIEANPYGMIRFNLYCSHLMSQNVEAQIFGIWIVPVFTGFKVREARTFSHIAPFYERLAWHNYQVDCIPLRINGYYCFDEPRYMRWYWNLAYTFISSPLKKNVHMCGSHYSRLHEIIDPADIHLLPTLFGGKEEIHGVNSRLLSPTNVSDKSRGSGGNVVSDDDEDIPQETPLPTSTANARGGVNLFSRGGKNSNNKRVIPM